MNVYLSSSSSRWFLTRSSHSGVYRHRHTGCPRGRTVLDFLVPQSLNSGRKRPRKMDLAEPLGHVPVVQAPHRVKGIIGGQVSIYS